MIASPFLWIVIIVAGISETRAQKKRFESMLAAFKAVPRPHYMLQGVRVFISASFDFKRWENALI